jgi:hypothetical protein
MAKRFIDTGLFDDSWFMDLSIEAKILWIYMITRCNHAGIIELNPKMVKLQTDITNLDEIIRELGNRIVTVSKESGNSMLTITNQLVYFIPKFITYQYPGFPNSKARAQESAIKILEEFPAARQYLFNSKVTVSEQSPNCYGNGNGNDYVKKGGAGGKKSKIIFPS